MTLDELIKKINQALDKSAPKQPAFVECPLEDFERLGNEVAAAGPYKVWLAANIDRQNFLCRGIPIVPHA